MSVRIKVVEIVFPKGPPVYEVQASGVFYAEGTPVGMYDNISEVMKRIDVLHARWDVRNINRETIVVK